MPGDHDHQHDHDDAHPHERDHDWDGGPATPLTRSPNVTVATVATLAASADELHHRDPFDVDGPDGLGGPDGPSGGEQWIACLLTRSAIILGSRQGDDDVDAAAAATAQLDVTRRRSGGGAVVLQPNDHVWIDTVSTPGAFADDVRESMVAVGERWASVLSQLSLSADPGRETRRQQSATMLSVHRGGLIHTRWSDQVCFAGVGPGEVLLDGRKLVGLSQRRTRHGAWVQATVYRRRQPLDVGAMMRPALDWSELPPIATLADLGLADIDVTALLTALATA